PHRTLPPFVLGSVRGLD
nr:T3 receptor [human, Peptide Partial Mutant, 17 aa] [Homo sapiens]